MVFKYLKVMDVESAFRLTKRQIKAIYASRKYFTYAQSTQI